MKTLKIGKKCVYLDYMEKSYSPKSFYMGKFTVESVSLDKQKAKSENEIHSKDFLFNSLIEIKNAINGFCSKLYHNKNGFLVREDKNGFLVQTFNFIEKDEFTGFYKFFMESTQPILTKLKTLKNFDINERYSYCIDSNSVAKLIYSRFIKK